MACARVLIPGTFLIVPGSVARSGGLRPGIGGLAGASELARGRAGLRSYSRPGRLAPQEARSGLVTCSDTVQAADDQRSEHRSMFRRDDESDRRQHLGSLRVEARQPTFLWSSRSSRSIGLWSEVGTKR